jgi:hypothetical protein
MKNPEGRISPEKPPFLYHGSTKGDITEFVPQISTGSGEQYGQLVYATPSLAVASIFMAKEYIRQPWSAGMYNGKLCAFIPIPKEDFQKRDKGGHIYTVASDTFSTQEGRGLGENEYGSTEAVKPVSVTHHTSALEAMLKEGVQVYFVTPEQIQYMKTLTSAERDAFPNTL